MKTISIILLSAIVLLAFKSQTNNSGNATAQRMLGLDVYVMSEPTRPYEIIKKQSWASALSCKESINVPVKKAAKFEGAQGVIIYFPTSDTYSIIKYKD